jgi:hypothetical protein
MTRFVMLPPVDPFPQPADTAPLALAVESTLVADTRPAAPIAAQTRASIRWPMLALAAYSIVAGGLLLRLLLGLYGVRTIMRSARPIGGDIYESAAIATPVTVGLIRPRVMVPPLWRDWPASTREAVFAHERAHARRRDPLVALIAGINRCAFWFHPLAWWLERNLADAAEDACDAAALQTIEQPRQYAEVLIAMAAASQRAGGRFVRAGAHVSGGRLSRRIDRILRGGPDAASPARRALAAAGCVLSVAIVAACQTQQAEVPPIGPPEVSQRGVEWRREEQKYEAVRAAARAMTAEEAAALERQWQRKPDLAIAERLLFFYEPIPGRLIPHSGGRMPENQQRITGRRPIVLWLIEHHPDSELLERRRGRVFPLREWLPDSQGYDAAKRLWLAHAARPDVTAKTLRTAASFLASTDRPLAEQLLLHGLRKYPDPMWSRELGRLYASAILVASGQVATLDRSASAEEVRANASKARATLATTRDALILATTAQSLATHATNFPRPGVEPEHLELARTYLERAIQLDPESAEARAGLDQLNDFVFVERESTLLAGTPPESKRDVIAKLPEHDRMVVLIRQATRDHLETPKDDWRSFRFSDLRLPERVDAGQSAPASRERSRQYAREALDLATRRPDDRDSADTVFAATIALGAHEFREGDRRTAVRYLLEAADAPPSVSRRTGSLVLGMSLERRLIGGLLQSGERQTVVDYFERAAKRRPADRQRLLAAATAIQNGKQPTNYERR